MDQQPQATVLAGLKWRNRAVDALGRSKKVHRMPAGLAQGAAESVGESDFQERPRLRPVEVVHDFHCDMHSVTRPVLEIQRGDPDCGWIPPSHRGAGQMPAQRVGNRGEFRVRRERGTFVDQGLTDKGREQNETGQESGQAVGPLIVLFRLWRRQRTNGPSVGEIAPVIRSNRRV